MSKNLFKEERDDLENISLEDLLEQEEQQNSNSKKEKLKGAGTQALDITKKVAVNVRDKADEVYQQKKSEYNYNKENGIDNFDDKLKKWWNKNGLMVILAKRKLISKLRPFEKEQEKENEQLRATDWILAGTYGIGQLFRYGWLGIGIALLIIFGLLFILGSILPFLIISVFILILLSPIIFILFTNRKYKQYSTKFDFKWYLDLIEVDEAHRPQNALATYYIAPFNAFLIDEELEKYLEEQGKKNMLDGATKASIHSSTIKYDDLYGWIRVFKLNNNYFMKKVNALSDAELNAYYLIPQIVNDSEYTDEVFYQSYSFVYQNIQSLMIKIFANDDNTALTRAKNMNVNAVVNDDRINYAFTEIAEQLEAKKEAEALALQAQKEQEELQNIQQQISEKGLSSEVPQIIKIIRDKKDDWNFNLWNGNDNMSGNASYFKARMILRNGKSLNDVKRIQSTIEAELRHSIVLNERQDKRAFDLTVILKPQLKSFEMKCKDLVEYNKNKLIYLGKSYTGDLITEWNYQANHIVVAGKSGAGKSEAIREILLQLSRLDEDGTDFDYTTMFLTSSSKIGDFADFGKNGALVASGIDKQIQVFSYILNMLEEREALFYKESVQNIKDYNKKHSDNRMKQIILLADEYENTRGDLDKKKAQEAESLMVSILNIARSSGCIVIIGAQSILKQDIGTIKDKMTIRFSGKNETNVLNTIDTSIANYYKSYRGKPQGVFMYQADNLEISSDYITQGETSFTLIQTPYITDISVKTLPQLRGAEFEDEIFKSESADNTAIAPKIKMSDI